MEDNNNIPSQTDNVPVDEGHDDDHSDVMTERDWLEIASRSYEDSETYLDNFLRTRMEHNYALAASRHPSGSKYHTESYKNRSKIFRGKTAAAIRRNMTAFTLALFSTQDAVSVKAENDGDKKQVDAARAIDKIQNYHVRRSFPWMRISNAAFRETLINSVVISKQWWKWEEQINEDGEKRVIKDHPFIELYPTENVRISPQADWLDPIESSPYCILISAMTLGDVKERMEIDWIEHDEGRIQSAATGAMEFDTTREAREQGNNDPQTETVTVEDYENVWVRENFVDHLGTCYVYFTLGDSLLLSYPMPVQDAYPHCDNNRPPVRMGTSDIEAFVVFSQSMTERVEGSQVQANDLANQRFDNIQQILNTRKLVQRGKNVDYATLMRNVSGGITLTDDLEAVKEMPSKDITSSAFQEQNFINQDFDEQAGTFSTASVGTARDLGETVGGAQLLSGNANSLTEFTLQVFVSTWVEPAMQDVAKMIQVYEDDEQIRRITGKEEMNSAALSENVVVSVDVGFGSTDPSQKINRLMYAIQAAAKIIPGFTQAAAKDEILAEIFGAVGYSDSKRFVPGIGGEENPQVKQLQQMVQQLQQQIQQETYKYQELGKLEKQKSDNDMALENQKHENDLAIEGEKTKQKALELAKAEKRDLINVMKDLKIVDLKGKQDLTKTRVKIADELKGELFKEEKGMKPGGGYL